MQDNQSKEPIKVQIVDNLSVQITPDSKYEFLITTNELAAAYGVTEKAIRAQKSRNEFVDGIHFFQSLQNVARGNLKYNRTFYTKRGMIRMGFFVKSERAEQVRNWAENALMKELESGGQTSLHLDIVPTVKPVIAKPAKVVQSATPQYDRELVEILVGIADAKTRTTLFTKLKKGGLL